MRPRELEVCGTLSATIWSSCFPQALRLNLDGLYIRLPPKFTFFMFLFASELRTKSKAKKINPPPDVFPFALTQGPKLDTCEFLPSLLIFVVFYIFLLHWVFALSPRPFSILIAPYRSVVPSMTD